MVGLKRDRTQLRRVFTKTCNEVDELLRALNPDKTMVIGKLQSLEDKSNRLFIVDGKIGKIMLSTDLAEKVFANEWDMVEKYRKKLILYCAKCQHELNEEKARSAQSDASASSSCTSSDKYSRRKFRLPKIELKRFNGNVRNGIGFWRQFRKIHEDNDIDGEDKFQKLLQATGPKSPAITLVQSFPPSAKNYQKAVSQLRQVCSRLKILG